MIMWLLDMRLCSRWSAFYYGKNFIIILKTSQFYFLAHLGFPLASFLIKIRQKLVFF